MLLLLLKSVGWLVAHTPEGMLRGLAAALGDFTFYCLPARRRLVLSNLHHAFPDRTADWHAAIGRESCRRLIETALLSLATPFLSESRLRTMVTAAPGLAQAHVAYRAAPQATLFCSPHLAYWESQTVQPLLVPAPFPEFGVIYRPLDHAAADAFVKRSRERFGMKLLSRKEGFADALKILRRRGIIGVLFDQNAGMQGALTTLFGRVCATTELPGVMAEKFNARVYGIFPRRREFWRIELHAEPVPGGLSSADVTIALNRWLEDLLQRDDDLCASWLWAHNRWRNQDIPSQRLRLTAKRDLLAAELRARGSTVLPRKTRIWVRLPNWLGDVMMAAPLLRALRRSRPDAEITVIGKGAFLGLMRDWDLADHVQALPPRGAGYFAHFRRLRERHPDVWLLFTNSPRGDLEARLAGCRHRFGIVRHGKWRPLLSHAYVVPEAFDERSHHQLELWEAFLRHFGLEGTIERAPFGRGPAVEAGEIGLIAGSENTPEKRWPVAHWRELIGTLGHEKFVLFGTPNDRPITAEIARGLPTSRVADLAGATDLPAFVARLARCRVLVTNDTGGMHLANALGIPVIGLFGPTNPVRTGPVFAAPTRLLQPPGCPPTGGAPLMELSPATVTAAVRELLAATATPV